MKRLATLVLVLLFAGCNDFTGSDTTDHVGVYSLSTVNGQGLPFTLYTAGGETVEVMDGSVTLNADRTFTDHTSFRVTTAGGASTADQVIQGRYLRSKSTVSFDGNDGSSYAASLDGATLMMMRGDFQVEYVR